MNRRQFFAVLAIVAALIAGTWAVGQVQESPDNTYANIERFMQVVTKVRDHYVEPVTSEMLMNAAIRGMLRTLDPYSQYLDQEEAERLETTTHGSFGGIGISIGLRDGWVTVISPIEGTPGWRAGIRGGDRIIKVDGVSTEGLSLDDAMKRMRGEKGTKVTLTVFREGVDKSLEFPIIRDIIQIKSVPYAGVLSNGIGYIRLGNFSERSREELDAALKKLDRENPRGLIVDLRYNPGGLLSQAVEVAEEFVPRGKRIVYTRGRDGSQNRDFYSSADQVHSGAPLIILVNQGTASASEIVSGAVQDLDLGIVVGKQTFGKGLVQTVFPLTRSIRGPKLKLTTAKYYTPSGRSIQKDEQLRDGALATASGGEMEAEGEEMEVEGEEVAPHPTRKSEEAAEGDVETPSKPLPEFRTEGGRIVYGGGGIMPDLVLDDVRFPRILEELERKQVFFKYAVKYGVDHKNAPENYEVSPQIYRDFVALLKAESVEFHADSLAAAERFVRTGIRRELARRFGSDEEAYRVAIEEDEQVQAAAVLFEKAPTREKLLTLAARMNKERAMATGAREAPVR